MASTNSEKSPPEGADGEVTAETENVSSIYEYREALWETRIRPMRSPLLGQIRPEGVRPTSGLKKNSKLGETHE
jgi:hypothetical protein